MSKVATRSTPKREAKPLVQTHQDVFYPLDFSFKAIGKFQELLQEKARPRTSRGALILEDELESEEGSQVSIHRLPSTAVKVNNNMLMDWEGFFPTIDAILVDSTQRLSWLDLSFNDFKLIDSALLQFPNLTTMYLHGNNIGRIAEVDKLSALTKLKSLALHGNPIETNPGYRQYILSSLAELKSLDFSGVTKADRATAATWKIMIAPKPKPRRRKPKE